MLLIYMKIVWFEVSLITACKIRFSKILLKIMEKSLLEMLLLVISLIFFSFFLFLTLLLFFFCRATLNITSLSHYFSMQRLQLISSSIKPIMWRLLMQRAFIDELKIIERSLRLSGIRFFFQCAHVNMFVKESMW